jgi:hypothetical protein
MPFRIFISFNACLILLLSVAFTEAQTNNTAYLPDEQRFISLFDSVMNSQRFIEKLDSGSFYNLPVAVLGGLNKDPNYSIQIDEVVLYPDHATFSASMVLTNPTDGTKMVFAAREIPFSFKGGILGDIRLELISQKGISLCKDIGLQILPGSYVTIDCHGFKALRLKAKVELNEEKFIPVDLSGKPKPGKVSAFFETTVQNWNNLTFSISFDPFQLKKYPDFTFHCQNLAVDFSDFENPSNLKFPENYVSVYPADMIKLWRGIYIEQAEIILNGNKFRSESSSAPVSFAVQNLIIDELGFSGAILARNLISLEKGRIQDWQFSVEEIALKFQTSMLTSGSLKGKIHIPAFKENTNFTYAACIDVSGNYAFTIGIDNTLSMELFGVTTLDLYNNSYISVISDSTGFVPTACFNGKLTFNARIREENEPDDPGNKEEFALADFEFQNFRISTREPKLDIECLAYHGSDQGKLSKFPVTINEIIFTSQADQAKLSVSVAVNLKKDSKEGFSGQTSVSVLARRVEYRYRFAGVQIDKIKIDAAKPGAFEIHGLIAFARGDTIYGSGFKGQLQARFGGNIEIKAEALFGHVNGYRYFFVDGMFAMKPGIQAGPITIFGFGGGLYYHMRQLPYASGVQYNFGRSMSGLIYRPDENIAIGIRAGVKLGVGSEQVLNAEVRFEIAFTAREGISYISFEGNAQFITPPINIDADKFKQLTGNMVEKKDGNASENNQEKPVGAIAANMKMFKDFENDEFHAEMEMYVNIAGVLTGVGPDNKAGWAVIHSSPGDWYIHVGTPSQPVGIKVLNFASLTGYFMAGHHLPTTMPINPEIMRILGISPEILANNRNESSLEEGKGVAFGASFELNTGDLTFLIFYASFAMGAGFDVMLTDYGPGAFCSGLQPPLGINGWYAKGQAYTYLSGKIGLEAKVFKKMKKFEILSIATAAYLRAELPNPLWMFGSVGGEYRILGGLIKGKCKFEFEVGEKCEIQGAQSALASLQLIGDITPSDKATGVDVFTTPQVVFNVPVEKMQKISETDGSSTYFRIKLVGLKLKHAGQEIPCENRWNYNSDVVQLIPSYVLYPETDYTLEAEIAFEELRNGAWVPFEEDGVRMTEKRETQFRTGDLPDRIPANEVVYSYPVDRQYNFMSGEYNKAYVAFRRDLQAFFMSSDKYTYEARWTCSVAGAVKTKLNYNSSEKTLYMDIPGSMANKAIYALEIVAVPTATSSAADRNVSTSYQKQETGSESTTIEQKTRKAEGTITTTEEKILLDFHFRTSSHNTLADRINKTNLNVRALYDRGYMEFYLITDMPGGEPFDRFEMKGGNGFDPLIQMRADLFATEWFTSDVYPKTYERYPWYNHPTIDDTVTYGFMAPRAIAIWQAGNYFTLNDNEIASGVPLQYSSFCDIAYMQPYYWDEDYMNNRDWIAYYWKDKTPDDPLLKTILSQIKLRAVKPGNYPVRFSYVLPGKNITTSTRTINLISTIKTDAADF